MKAISLFSGAGGMDVGFRSAGFDIIWANDIDKDACETYRLNHGPHMHQGDLDLLLPQLEHIAKESEISCLFGGPPCQGFSVAGKMDAHDPRSKLVWSFMKAVRITKPLYFVMENVKALGTLEKFSNIREGLFKEAISLGYSVDLVILNSKDYDVPQNRERMFFVGFRGKKNKFKESISAELKTPKKLREVLINVGKAGTPSNNRLCKAKITTATSPIMRRSPYAGMLFNGQGRPMNLDGHSATLPASMGGNRTPIIDELALYENHRPWIETYHSHLIEGGSPTEWESVPSRLRRLTIDEAIAIQTFPGDYNFSGGQSSIFKQIGNAVPCNLAAAVARTVINLIKNQHNPTKSNEPTWELDLEIA